MGGTWETDYFGTAGVLLLAVKKRLRLCDLLERSLAILVTINFIQHRVLALNTIIKSNESVITTQRIFCQSFIID